MLANYAKHKKEQCVSAPRCATWTHV